MRVVGADKGSSTVVLDLTVKAPIENQVTLEWGKLAQKPQALSLSPLGKSLGGAKFLGGGDGPRKRADSK